MAPQTRAPALFEVSAPSRKAGPVYQGVAAAFRSLFPKHDEAAQERKRELAGHIRLALDHAHALDRDPRATVGRAQTSAELRETLATIRELAATGDAFAQLLEVLNNVDAPPAHSSEPR